MPRPDRPLPASDRRQRVQAAETGVAILKALAALGGSASLTLLAQTVGESAAKVHRYLSSFAAEGLVAQNAATHHYYLGPEMIRIGLAAQRQCDPVRLGDAALVRMREALQVTCFIAVMGNMGPTVVRIEEPSLPVTVNMRAGSVLPLLWSATGQTFLAFSADSELQQRAERELQAGTVEQRALLAGAEPVAQLCRQVQRQGCAIVHDLLLPGISAVSAPVWDAGGRLAAVLTALGASNGFDARLGGSVCAMVMQEAADISLTMGFKPA